jgi:hypothetical protein
VAEAVGEVVGEELLGGAELTAGSMGWGNNRRRLPSARSSRRKTTAGEIPWPVASRRCGQALGAGGAK